MQITPSQIGQYAQQAGFRGNALTTAIAIAMAESGGNTTATNHNTNGTTDYGLWQINSVHSQYSPALLLNNPLYNAQAAYTLSSNGSNWQPWTTYNTGAYRQYLPQAQAATLGSVSSGTLPTTGAIKPWYTFPRIDNLGGIEPFGGFPKPDSNIQLPANYPVTALLPGTVTAIDGGEVAWGGVITIALDAPLNALATHTAYLHLAGIASGIRVGAHVAQGQLIAYNGSGNAQGAQKVPLGFALYNGDHYGFGNAWSLMTKANLNGGMLDPVPLLNAAAAGTLPVSSGGVGIPALASLASYTPVTQLVHQTLINTAGFYGMALALDEAEQFPGWIDLTNPTGGQQISGVPGLFSDTSLPDFAGIARSIGATVSDNFLPFAIRSGLIAIGLSLLLALVTKPIMSIAQVVKPAAEMAVMA